MTEEFIPHPLFTKKCEFIAGAGSIDSLPPVTAPEIAFIGRSNVGKSSLVNALVGQKALARTSANPGMTKQLNFFALSYHLVLVDMPGYGYAKVSKARKSEWDDLIRSYLLGRTSLKRACLLIDARRGIMEKDDDFMTLLDKSAVNYQIILTKIDALTAKDLGVLLESVKITVGKHVGAHPEVIATSSLRKEGINALQEQLLPFAIT
jgi:GTP-binding protein